MASKLFKSGQEINMSVADASFKVFIGRQSKKDDFQKIEVPSEWRGAVKDLEIGSECVLTSEKEDQTYTRYRMILIEKQLEQLSPILLLKPYKEPKKHSELRQHNRINAFVFTILSKEDDIDLDKSKEKPFHGTISDFSTSGCLLMSDHLFNVSSHIWLVFSLLDDGAAIKVKCQIKSRRKSHIEKCYFYGLEFKGLSTAEIEMIRSYIENPNE